MGGIQVKTLTFPGVSVQVFWCPKDRETTEIRLRIIRDPAENQTGKMLPSLHTALKYVQEERRAYE